ncbi:DUF3515 domain-containing protein [Mycobacterium sp.]|jgi:hypothetical protein|uniref:DUF3515 domain-containing protein n=1 Tax=Mycobacterium sp. TaxID=1785 RepID=UPI002D4C7C95|nr:DUF3515 domain-containing protein [Mycobacterium sp.]HZA10993.1 DUF3515 domain-containing protein [Mycobacterium sp.]
MLIIAVAVATAAVIAVLVVAVASRGKPAQRPIALPALPAPQAAGPECRRLLSTLPRQLGDFPRATLAEPAPPGAAAWRQGGDDPVVLRCGVDPPADFVVGSPIQVVDAVQWFPVIDGGRSTWFAVDRPVYVALTLPQNSGPTPIQEVSDAITQTMPAVPIRPGPPR